MTDIAMIHAARDRMGNHAVRTPLLSSPFLDEIAGRRLFVKAECLQQTGSFKFRGAWSAISALDKEARHKGVIAFSSGNHAQGVALAARMHGIPAVIVMPSNAPRIKIDNTRAYGADVVLYDRATQNRDEIAQHYVSDRGLTLVRPFDDPQVIAGQGTVGLEIAEQARDMGIAVAEVLVPCGGGGLSSGVALALEAVAPGFTVRTVEPEGFDDTARSLVSGRIEHNAGMTGSICDAVLSPSPGEITLPVMQRLCGSGLIVSDDEAMQAMALAFLRLKIVIEPGSAVALAAALFRPEAIAADTLIAIASGGNVDADLFQEALRRFGGSTG
ncbi:threonine ammonia-lyase [Neorhizobium sp. NPDC001467]|uniref:threonine ammonia-lyase n=1 Tax=Neorhizobium sp. NPDC001467 TaxID=3390595 RepID=UPI003CFCD9C7